MVVPPNRQNRRAEPEDLDSDSESSSDDDTLLPIEPSASEVPSNNAREENPNPLTRRPQADLLNRGNFIEQLAMRRRGMQTSDPNPSNNAQREWEHYIVDSDSDDD